MEDILSLLSTFKHQTKIQIRFKDVDKIGHVNNANHLTYFEIARVEYFNDVFRNKINWQEISMILAKSEITYKLPILLEDKLVCYTKISKLGNKSFDTEYLLVKTTNGKPELCAFGKAILVCMNYKAHQTVAIPQEWISQITEFENL